MAISARHELLKTMRATVPVLRGLVHGRSLDELRRRPAPGEWTPAEVICHLADTEERAMARVQRMLGEEEPVLPGYDQAQLAVERRYGELDALAELDRYERLRSEHVTLLESLDDAGWQRRGRHSEHGQITVELLIAHVAAEDVDHLAQIARAMISGPAHTA
ncbi:MAG TPA: DinB family protein [Candidatus Limnocylindria bacterium]|nr:DinB family protein [Candidatus Limnocylindria bacterium]